MRLDKLGKNNIYGWIMRSLYGTVLGLSRFYILGFAIALKDVLMWMSKWLSSKLQRFNKPF
ncbi:MAG: hypothetical protein AAF378_00235 [Cyanobacteria bacterium P01_A01_bin.84]